MRSLLLLLATASLAFGQLGRPASEAEIEALAISVAPDGTGLPPGEGTAAEGARAYQSQCRECHGPEGQGGDETSFIGNPSDLTGPDPSKTVGSYWPHATTLFDYIRRAMPFTRPGTLTDDQVYALTAYLLHLNGLIDEDEPLNAENLPAIEMPNRGSFVRDPRPDVD